MIDVKDLTFENFSQLINQAFTLQLPGDENNTLELTLAEATLSNAPAPEGSVREHRGGEYVGG